MFGKINSPISNIFIGKIGEVGTIYCFFQMAKINILDFGPRNNKYIGIGWFGPINVFYWILPNKYLNSTDWGTTR